jgi:hypothetical protein
MRFPLLVRIILMPFRLAAFLLWLVPSICLVLMGEKNLADNGYTFIMEYGNE